ncbi:hypothetical protein FH972_022806 [Carpinus fangiana]|uniref:Uncharacterized protein n=1 Tax=Carpinus fangiana TaxID=176857 RepID=A0A5N6KTZ5_9ROSI|nr:hypothetical protein FH972_022806 [Carpinus fangiana]
MVKGLDELVDFAVERIALHGTKGATADDVQAIVHEFYASPDPSPSSSQPLDFTPVVDHRFCAKVWSWLCKHDDIRVRMRPVVDESSQSTAAPRTASNPTRDALNAPGAASTPQSLDPPKNLQEAYLTVRTARIWHAIAGHGPDPKRLPAMSFTILSIIAWHGSSGILQPEITMLSGQDKRSVPKRTDELARNGYIEKRTVLSKGHKTSLCTLAKFIKASTTRVGGPENTSELLELAFKDRMVRHDAFIKAAIPLIKAAGVISLNDLKRHFGIINCRWESRVLNDFLVRMEVIGLISKQRATVDGYDNPKATLRSVAYIRDPTPAEVQTFCSMGRLDPNKKDTNNKPHDDEEDEETFDSDPSNETQRQEVLATASQTMAVPISWHPLRNITNSIFDVVDKAGVRAVSTMDLINRFAGPFFRRPVEHTMAHFTDAWEAAQPEYLRHFSIIRDVGQKGRYTYYIYRSYPNFDRATEVGDTTWEAVTSQKKRPSNWIKNRPLDEWGFPAISEKLLVSTEYVASPVEARRALRNIRNPGRILGEAYNPAHVQQGKGKSLSKKPINGPPKKIGRPPKSAANISSQSEKNKQDEESTRKSGRKRRPLLRVEESASSPAPDEETENVNTPLKRDPPTKPLLNFKKQMSELAARIARKELGLTKDQVSQSSGKVQQASLASGMSVASDPMELLENTIPPSGNKRPQSLTDESGAKRRKVSGEPADKDETLHAYQSRVQVLQAELINMSYPTAYLNPPQHLVWKKGRPRAAALLVIKNPKLKNLAWFTTSDIIARTTPYLARGSSERHSTDSFPVIVTKQTEPNAEPRAQRAGVGTIQESQNHNNVASVYGDMSKNVARSGGVTLTFDMADSSSSPIGSIVTPLRRTKEVSIPRKRERSLDDQPRPTSIGSAYEDAPEAVDTVTVDLSWVHDSRPLESNKLGRSIVGIMSSQSAPRKRMKPSIAPGAERDKSTAVGASRAMMPHLSPLSDPALPAKRFIATSIEFRSGKIPPNPDFEGMAKTNPYGCVKCGRRYRNVNGLEYHVDHARECFPERFEYMQEQKAQKKAAAVASPKKLQSTYSIDTGEIDDFEVEHISAREQNDDSKETTYVPPFLPSGRNTTSAPKKETNPRLPSKSHHKPKTGTVMRTGGSIMHKRYGLALEIVRANGGAFPGDRALYPVFVTAWRKSGGEGTPDMETLKRTVNNLVNQLKINRFYLAYKAGGSMQKVCVLTLPDVTDVNSEPVQRILRGCEEAYPRMYIPPGADIADDLVSTAIQSRPGQSSMITRVDRYPMNADVTVRRLRQPLVAPSIGTTNVPAWAKWADGLPQPGTVPPGNSHASYTTRDDQLESILDQLEEGADLSGWTAGQKRKWGVANLERSRGSPRKKSRTNSMHNRVQASKKRREEELRKSWQEVEDLEADITAEQAAMQASFELGGLYHHSSINPEHFLTGFKGQGFPKRATGTIRWAGLRDGTGERVDSIARKPATSKSRSSWTAQRRPSTQDSQTSASETMASEEEDPQPLAALEVNPMAWVTGIRRQAEEMSPPPRRTVGPISVEPVSMVFSFDENAAPDARGSPQSTRRDAASHRDMIWGRRVQTTLTDPSQVLHGATGTFSTDFAVMRKLRPQLRIAAPDQKEFEDKMAAAFSRLDPDSHMKGSEIPFFDIDDVAKWETKHYEELTSNMELIQTRWINHTVDSEVAQEVPWNLGTTKKSTNRHQPVAPKPGKQPRREKVLKRPAPKPRVSRASDQQSKDRAGPKTAESAIKEKAPRMRQTRQNYLDQHAEGEDTATLDLGVRGRKTLSLWTQKQLDRVMAAVAIAQVLAGGRENTLDWPLVDRLLANDGIDSRYLKLRWFTLRTRNSVRLAEWRLSFQLKFLQAAELDEIKVPDYDNAEEYDWKHLLNWMMENVVAAPSAVKSSSSNDPLPEDRSAFDQGWSLAKDDLYFYADHDQYKPVVTVKRKEELAGELEWSVPCHGLLSPAISDVSETARAESWMRSNILANGAKYDAKMSRKLLERIPPPILDQALTTYLDNKWLKVLNKGRLGPGRNYVPHEFFMKLVRPEATIEEICHPAVKFKLALDEELARAGRSSSTLHSKRGEAVVLLNLAGAGRVALEPMIPPATQDPVTSTAPKKKEKSTRLLSVFGFVPCNYVTKNIAKDKTHIDVCVRPTPTYIPGTGPVPPKSKLPGVPTPHLDIHRHQILNKPTPIWGDLQGRVNLSMWNQILMCVLLDVTNQSGKDSERLALRYKGAVSRWELEVVLQWLQKIGVVERTLGADGEQKGWIAREWWWCVFGNGFSAAESAAAGHIGAGHQPEKPSTAKGKKRAAGRTVSFALPDEAEDV